jgi:hypothetical protein
MSEREQEHRQLNATAMSEPFTDRGVDVSDGTERDSVYWAANGESRGVSVAADRTAADLVKRLARP